MTFSSLLRPRSGCSTMLVLEQCQGAVQARAPGGLKCQGPLDVLALATAYLVLGRAMGKGMHRLGCTCNWPDFNTRAKPYESDGEKKNTSHTSSQLPVKYKSCIQSKRSCPSVAILQSYCGLRLPAAGLWRTSNV